MTGRWPHLSHTATFGDDDSRNAIVADLSCPSCGHDELDHGSRPVDDGTMHVFCDHCTAWITVTLTPQQAATFRRHFLTNSEF
jgi:hypothetical protein